MKFASRLTALCLGAALLLTPCTLAADAQASLTPTQKQEDLEFLYTTLKQTHPDLFAHTPEAEFLAQKETLEARLAQGDDLTFALDVMAFTALVGDSHTTASLPSTDSLHFFPFALQWFEGQWVTATLPAQNAKQLGLEVTALNGHTMEEVEARFATLVSADNPVKLRRQTKQLLYTADILAYLGLCEPGGDVTLTLAQGDPITLSPLATADLSQMELSSLAAQRPQKPATTSAQKNYFALPLDESTYYIQYNRCQQDPQLPMADFAAQVEADLAAKDYKQVLLDLRNNGGGSDGVLQPLLSTLAPAVRDGSLRLWGLIGETTYSSAVINAVMISEMGGYLAGTPSSGSADHFGATDSFTLPHSGLRVSCSTKWIDLATLMETGIPYGVEPLAPDLIAEQTMADYLAGQDTLVNCLLADGLDYQAPDHDGEPLTRGRLLDLLYQAAKADGRDVSAPENRFYDTLPFAYYAPAADWAQASGLALGNGDGGLSPAQPVTRAEAVVLLDRFAQSMGIPLDQQATIFSDQALIPAWALESAGRAGALEMLDVKTTAFRPNETMTRADGQRLVSWLME